MAAHEIANERIRPPSKVGAPPAVISATRRYFHGARIPRRRRLVTDLSRGRDRSRSGIGRGPMDRTRSNEISRGIDRRPPRTREMRVPIITRQCGDMSFCDAVHDAAEIDSRLLARTFARRIPTKVIRDERANDRETAATAGGESVLHRKCVKMAPTDLRVISMRSRGSEQKKKTQKRNEKLRRTRIHTHTETGRWRGKGKVRRRNEMCSRLPTVYIVLCTINN